MFVPRPTPKAQLAFWVSVGVTFLFFVFVYLPLCSDSESGPATGLTLGVFAGIAVIAASALLPAPPVTRVLITWGAPMTGMVGQILVGFGVRAWVQKPRDRALHAASTAQDAEPPAPRNPGGNRGSR